ncbi:hypothetical protein U0C82_03785 [Fulvimarina sp. 2208YS6-2-32]|uniref:Terminase small subunit n=1 Tax=Fulvimarina uroteuthidis TaxID=3098149 RepID=A0ABU5HYS4_9HYPH|nr:hypothetical protein [Fulvimarina sp. 2208YS6-2-32]MDY8108270.1 hypothetical protein [Fulvimarina sp. 2208YS6-2-32]
MAQRGGKRPGAGRKKGNQDAATLGQKATIAELARGYADDAMGVLHQIAMTGESEAARVSASNAILDRAFGKPAQAMEHSGPDGSPLNLTTRIELVAPGDDDS